MNNIHRQVWEDISDQVCSHIDKPLYVQAYNQVENQLYTKIFQINESVNDQVMRVTMTLVKQSLYNQIENLKI